MVRSLAAWLWLVNARTGGVALDASDDASGELAASLMGHFSEVHVLRATAGAADAVRASNAREGWTPASVTHGSASAAPWAPATFDCIALHDAMVRRGLAGREIETELGALYTLLRPDGWLALASPKPPMPLRRTAVSGGLPRRRLMRTLSKIGFREVRCLFAEPNLERPLTLLPDTRTSIAAYEQYAPVGGASSWKRRIATRMGVRTPLYPGYFLLARA